MHRTVLTADCLATSLSIGRVRRTAFKPLQAMRRLKYNTLVPNAPGDMLAIEVFQQGNRIFARDAGELLECRHRQARAAFFCLYLTTRSRSCATAARWKTRSSVILISTFSRSKICRIFCARGASTGTFSRTVAKLGTASPARSNSRSITSLACASSGESAISRPARCTRSPET